MTKVVFEIQGLADALHRAAAVAPRRGEGFDKAAGILINVEPGRAVVKATNLAAQFATWLTPHEVLGEPIGWRLSHRVFPDVIGKLKTIRNPEVTLEDVGGRLKMTHGRTTATFGMMETPGYPDWMPFDSAGMTEVAGLAEIVGTVGWAAASGDKATPPLDGVHFDGAIAVATDRHRVCSTACQLELSQPITVAAGVLRTILRAGASVLVRADDRHLHVMPDEYTQISLIKYGVAFPPVNLAMRRDHPGRLVVGRQALLDCVQLALAGADKSATVRLFIGQGEIAAMVSRGEDGFTGDVIELEGQADHPRVEYLYNQDYLAGALSNAKGEEITIGYDIDTGLRPLHLTCRGVEYWLAPMSPQAAAATEA